MTAIPVEMSPPSRIVNEEEDIVVIGDVDEFTERRIVCGCGDDNPYR